MISSRLFGRNFSIYLDQDCPVYENDRIGRLVLIRKNASSSLEHTVDHSSQWRRIDHHVCQRDPAYPMACLLREPKERLLSGLRTVLTDRPDVGLDSADSLLEEMKQGRLVFDCHTWPQVMYLNTVCPDPTLWRPILMVQGWQEKVQHEWDINITEHQNAREGWHWRDRIKECLESVPQAVETLLKPDYQLWHSQIK